MSRAPRLFFIDLECVECPKYVLNPQTDEWEKTESEPAVGDHAVIDGIEKVAVNGSYRMLRAGETEMWDEVSVPDESCIEEIIYAENTIETPFKPVRRNLHVLTHW